MLKLIKKTILSGLILINLAVWPLLASTNPPTLILIRPQQKQIENLLVLKKQGLLLPAELQVIAVYHEDELTDYQPARAYVMENQLTWVQFETIHGGIDMTVPFPGRSKNAWSAQFDSLFEKSDGILFTGGMDIPPRLYGQEMRLTTEATTPVRSVYEISFLYHLLSSQDATHPPLLKKKPDYAILCICLGCQSLNVASGGTLIQNIPSEVYGLSTYEQVLKMSQNEIHSGRYQAGLNSQLQDQLPPAMHAILGNGQGRITPKLFKESVSQPQVLSSHHQALGRIGNSLLVTATSMDGRIVEMVEHTEFKAVLGVQYHPEALALYRPDIRFRTCPPYSSNKGSSDQKIQSSDSKRDWLNYGPISQTDTFCLVDYLKETQSSEFHTSLWRWFSSALQTSAAARKNPK